MRLITGVRRDHGYGHRADLLVALKVRLSGDNAGCHHFGQLMSISTLDILEQVKNIRRGRFEDGAPSLNMLLAQVLTQAFSIQPGIQSHVPQVLRQRPGLHISNEQSNRGTVRTAMGTNGRPVFTAVMAALARF
ncbi:hypothetical protein HCA61_18665 [Rhodococcus sp. HNM0563]|uniref:hypothetical protein n=1 Tax=Rhodococcus sp. HNM0563 TaxID=2716339 RepID=UPI00146CFE9A|nr:hypothetical protein [Rhodococcus sp. HNM0563]NLU64272.1 hypothetical protein [Rhodococcus sp. HNM0563]